jgi:hypothetical protein
VYGTEGYVDDDDDDDGDYDDCNWVRDLTVLMNLGNRGVCKNRNLLLLCD